MDVIGGVASATQLVAYSSTAASYLSGLYRAAQDGPSSMRDQLQDIKILVEIINSIPPRKPSDPDFLIPLLIEIADIARSLTRFLSQEGQFRTVLVLLTKGSKIEDGFKALRSKGNLLQLYLSGKNHEVLNQVRLGVECIGRNMSSSNIHTLRDVRVRMECSFPT